MITSKLEAREKALELAFQLGVALQKKGFETVMIAKEFERYLIGKADLPETNVEKCNQWKDDIE